jgi:ring-1,2-phenylacetyl-CoA epoxidase subunit PaaC
VTTPSDYSPPPLRSSHEQSVGDPDPSSIPSSAAGTHQYVLGLADDALVAAQRMGEWIATSPQIEEDVALGNIALDLLGQARSLLSYAGSLMEPPRDEDELAYFRDASDFRNVHLVERPWGAPEGRGDFGVAMARLLVLSTYMCELYARLQTSTDETLAAVAAKAVKEVDYHRDHATLWVLRLGDGTDESHRRMQDALDAEWPHVDELFDGSYVDPRLLQEGVAVDPTSLRDDFDQRIADVLLQATLRLPEVPPALGSGRRGEHGDDFVAMLTDMQSLARKHPGVTW